MSKIKEIIAKEIKDSRGNPTVQVTVETDKGSFVASVPSGASTGKNEALELRDADGKGVSIAIKNVNDIIAPKLKGRDVLNQREVDEFLIKLDGTDNKSKLGANAILGVSMAVCRAGAATKKTPLYQHIASLRGGQQSDEAIQVYRLPRSPAGSLAMTGRFPIAMFNLLEGGRHAKNDLDFQEFMVVPHKKTMQENLVVANEVFLKLKEELEKEFCPPVGGQGKEYLELGDEGGFAPPISSTERALIFLRGASEAHSDVKFALDVAASEFYKNGKYVLEGQDLTRSQMLDFYKSLLKGFPIISIEDPYAETDWQGFEEMFKELGQSLTIVGDDLTTTNIKIIKEAHNKQAINAVLIKLNQIGSVSETIDAINMTKSFGWKTIVSHRSGETMDDFIADLAVGAGVDFIKSGSPAKPERMEKYKRIIEIEREISLAK